MKYSPATKKSVVNRYQHNETIVHISEDTGIARSTLYSWIHLYSRIASDSGTSVTLKNYDDLKRHSVKLEHIIEILKTVNCTISASLQSKLCALEPLYGQYSGYELCEALEVPRGTFYNHILRNKRDGSSYAQRRREISPKIIKIHNETG